MTSYLFVVNFHKGFVNVHDVNKYKQMYRIALNLETNMQYVQNRAY